MKESNFKKILIDQLNNNGVIFEQIEQFEGSIYSDIYEKATRLVEEIVGQNKDNDNELRKIKYVKKEKEIPNVISFIGRRGTGKTSAMLSFYEELQKYSKHGRYSTSLEFSSEFMQDVDFKGLDCIDASSLEESEDIFVLVLAQMLQRILDIPKQESASLRDYDNRSLLQKFESLYEDFVNIKKQTEVDMDGYSSFERLKNVTSSQKIRKQFAELVETYLQLLSGENACMHTKKNSYLVIAIDDLDMYKYPGNKKSGQCGTRVSGSYEIMRSISQYLSVPNVIILVAYNHVSLYEKCLDDFSDSGKSEKCCRSDYKEIKFFSNKETASQYMEKIFPINTRLYMPSWRKRDFDNENKIRIDISSRKKDETFLPLRQQQKKYLLSPKEFIFSMLADKTDVYFDCNGRKKHFFEPDTLRALYSIYSLLESMKDFSNLRNPGVRYAYYQDNLKLLKEDVYFRYIEEKLLDAREKNIFDHWLEQPIDRRSRAIVQMVSQDTEKLGKVAKRHYEERIQAGRELFEKLEDTMKEAQLILSNKHVNYSYAELVHSIYHMTRDGKYSKELVACILYSYTVCLTEIFWKYKWYKKQIPEEVYKQYIVNPQATFLESEEVQDCLEEIKNSYQVLKAIIGEAVCGRWTEYYFPEVRADLRMNSNVPKLTDRHVLGYIEACNQKWVIRFPYAEKAELENQLKLIVSGCETELLYKIYQLIFIASLQSNILSWAREDVQCKIVGSICEIENTESDFIEQESRIEFHFQGTNPEIKYAIDLTGAFKYTFCYGEFLGKLEQLVLQSYENTIKEIGEDADRNSGEKIVSPNAGKAEKKYWKQEELDAYKKLIQAAFSRIRADYIKWDLEFGNMMLPVYNLDISYNMIKRIFLKCKEETIPALVIDSGKTIEKNIEGSNENISKKKSNKDFFYAYRSMLQRFEKHLKELDEYYGFNEANGKFLEAYRQCPFYKMIEVLCKDEVNVDDVTTYIFTIVEWLQEDMEVRKSLD